MHLLLVLLLHNYLHNFTTKSLLGGGRNDTNLSYPPLSLPNKPFLCQYVLASNAFKWYTIKTLHIPYSLGFGFKLMYEVKRLLPSNFKKYLLLTRPAFVHNNG